MRPIVPWISSRRRGGREAAGPARGASSATTDAGLVSDLVAALGADAVLTEPTSRWPYGRDASLVRGETPPVVCLPATTAQVSACVRIASVHDRAFVARGAGTGLAGGAIPVADPVVISTTRMNRVISVDAITRRAEVQPGVLNLDLNRRLAPLGLRFAPDPSSQQACTIGGNIANNSGGPHCLALGVTSAHVLGLEVVLADGSVVALGGSAPEPAGYDLRGAFVGSEGTLGIATGALLRLVPLPPHVSTLLCTFDDLDEAAACVSDIIGAGMVPAALEMMDGPLAAAVEDFCHAGYPRDAAAVLLVELEGGRSAVASQSDSVRRIADEHSARNVRVAADDKERDALWMGRKNAFGAVARIAPDYYLHDTVVPRTRLVEVLAAVRDIAAQEELLVVNVFHAGDGNLHPLLLFDARDPGVMERVERAGSRIVEVSLAAGGVLSGEHGIGLEKRHHMSKMFGPDDLEAQRRLRCAFDPLGRSNPTKVLPGGSGCGETSHRPGDPARDAAAGLWV